MDIALILFLTLIAVFSSRENFMLDTRINYIPYENEVYSSKE